MRFDLVDLGLIVAVAEASNITRGAARAGMALASASERIRAMEQALGAQLFDRKRRGVVLTPAGSLVVRHAQVVLQQLERMRGELHDYARGLRGRVRLLSNTAATLEFLPPVLGAFMSMHPHIDIELRERPSGQIVRAIASGLADVGIVADAVARGERLETFPFAVDQLVLITPARHPLAGRRQIAFEEVLDCDFVGLAPDSALQAHINDHAVCAGRPLRLRVSLPSFDAICRIVESGIGVAIVPQLAAQRCRRSMAIRAVRLIDAWAFRHLRLCVRNFRSLPAHAQWLVQHLNPPADISSSLVSA